MEAAKAEPAKRTVVDWEICKGVWNPIAKKFGKIQYTTMYLTKALWPGANQNGKGNTEVFKTSYLMWLQRGLLYFLVLHFILLAKL